MKFSAASAVGSGACALALAARAGAWPGVSGGKMSDEQMRRLAWRSSLIVAARLESRPQPSNIVISDSYLIWLIWMLRLRPSMVFKGRRPHASTLDAEFDTSGRHLKGRRPEAPPSRVGAPYLTFLVDESPNLPRWKVIGMKAWSLSLALQLRRVQAARPAPLSRR